MWLHIHALYNTMYTPSPISHAELYFSLPLCGSCVKYKFNLIDGVNVYWNSCWDDYITIAYARICKPVINLHGSHSNEMKNKDMEMMCHNNMQPKYYQ